MPHPTRPTQHYRDGRYIVTFADDPVGAYDGYQARLHGHEAEGRREDRPQLAGGQELARSPDGKHDAALAKVGATKIYDYTVTNNGIAADLTGAQAAALAKTAGHRRARTRQDVPARHHCHLRIPRPERCGRRVVPARRPGRTPARASSSASSTAASGPRTPRSPTTKINPRPANWHGACVAGRTSRRRSCGNKLVGARYYVDGFGKHNISEEEFLSPRDGSGHGSHTASTAAGNAGVTDDHRRQPHRHRVGHGPSGLHRRVQGVLGGQARHPRRVLQLRQRRRDQRRDRSTVSTSSTTRSVARPSRRCSTRSRRRSVSRPTRASSWRTPPATADRVQHP